MCFSGGYISGRLWVTELPNAHCQGIPRHWLEPNRRRTLFVLPTVCCFCQWLVLFTNNTCFGLLFVSWLIENDFMIIMQILFLLLCVFWSSQVKVLKRTLMSL